MLSNKISQSKMILENIFVNFIYCKDNNTNIYFNERSQQLYNSKYLTSLNLYFSCFKRCLVQ